MINRSKTEIVPVTFSPRADRNWSMLRASRSAA
jgi:hypothetical protein